MGGSTLNSFLGGRKFAISCDYVYCLIFDSVLVRVVDYLELVSELLLLHARCAIFLLYHGVKLYESYILMIWHCHSIYSRPTLLGGIYITNSQNSPPVDMLFQSLWSLLLFLWWGFSANKEITRSLGTFYGHCHDMDNRYGVYVLWMTNGYVPFVVITIRSCPPHSWPYHRVCNKTKTTSATRAPGHAYTSFAHEFNSGISWSSCFSFFRFLCNVLVDRY